MTEVHSFGVDAVTAHSWSKDRTALALSLNNTEFKVFQKNGGGWKESATLTEHGQRVTGIDWAAESNRIVTCGADRNAYVWEYVANTWQPKLVLLRINRAATCVRWSPQENKFAVGSGARLVSICYFEQEHNWWVSKHIKKPIRSTVTAVDWHPNNIVLACASTDFKARVFSGYIKEVEKKPGANAWGSKLNLGSLLAEFSNGGGGWVHSVSFSPSGDKLAWVGHDSSVSVVTVTDQQAIATVKNQYLPFMSCSWIAENSLVAAGYDCCPILFSYSAQGELDAGKKLDIPKEKESGKQSAMARFQALDKRAATDEGSSDLKTQHQNTILELAIHTGTKENCGRFSTAGVDGKIIIWDCKSLEASIAGLRIA